MEILILPDIAVNYLSFLDYIDIKNLRRCNKELNKLCMNEQLFKNILINHSDLIVIDNDVSVLDALNDFYIQVEKHVFDRFFPKSDVPTWVNYEHFKIINTKIIAKEFVKEYIYLYDDMQYDYYKGYPEDYMGGSFCIEIEKILFPFHSKKVHIMGDQMSGQVIIEIMVTDNMKKYMIETLENCFDSHYKNLKASVKDMHDKQVIDMIINNQNKKDKNKFKSIVECLLFV